MANQASGLGSKRAAVAALLAGIALSTTSERAYACSPVPNDTLEVANGRGGEAPSGIGDPSVTLSRGNGTHASGCGRSSTSCDDMGSFQVHFTLATDADSPPNRVGYRIELVAGRAPGYSLAEYLGRVLVPNSYFDDPEGRGTLFFHWDDGDTDDQEDVDFTITLTPVDIDGNEGPVSDPIRIRDGGSDGCSVGERRFSPGGFAAALSVAAGALVVVRRRTRPRVTSRISCSGTESAQPSVM